jgi:hypothetical protein
MKSTAASNLSASGLNGKENKNAIKEGWLTKQGTASNDQ